MKSLTFHHRAAPHAAGSASGESPRPDVRAGVSARTAGLGWAERGRRRGFTLVELMTVVIIIGILMVIAVPGIAHRMQEYHSQQAANEIAALYRNARSRAMARGSAVIVRWDSTAQTFDVYEALSSAAETGCAPRVSTACQNAPELQLINHYSVAITGDNEAKVYGPAGASAGSEESALDICFTPLGTVKFRESNNIALPVNPMNGVAQVIVSRPSQKGLKRAVLWLPNGTSRVTVPDQSAIP